MAIKYGKTGKIVAKTFTMARLEAGMSDQCGFCLACGYEQGGCEPDARKYECERCTHKLVFGSEEIALMGYVRGGE
jgi:hypothetical protein